MPQITFLQKNGSKLTVHACQGYSLMEVASSNSVDGIVAECSGNAMCATCHVLVEECPNGALPAMSEVEDELLDCTATKRDSRSRLSCQIPIVDEFDGLVVRLPEAQA